MAIPAVVAGIVGAFVPALVSGVIWLFKRVMVAFGVGLVAYQGVKPFIDFVINQVITLLSASDPYNIAAWLGVVRFGECVSVILSAMSFALTVRLVDRVQFKMKPPGT